MSIRKKMAEACLKEETGPSMSLKHFLQGFLLKGAGETSAIYVYVTLEIDLLSFN